MPRNITYKNPLQDLTKIVERIEDSPDKIQWNSGSVLGSNLLNITITQGEFHNNLTKVNTNPFDSSTQTFSYYYGVNTEIINQNSINVLNYDNESVLTVMTDNYYRSDYVLLDILTNKVSLIMGTSQHIAIIDAIDEDIPNTIAFALEDDVIIGKIIVQKNATSLTSVKSSFENPISAVNITSHNVLSGLDSDDHPQYAKLQGRAPSEAIHINNINPQSGTSINTTANKLISSDVTSFTLENNTSISMNINNIDNTKCCSLKHNGNEKFMINGTVNESANPIAVNNINPLTGDILNTTAKTILSSSSLYLSLQNTEAVSLNVTGVDPLKYCTLQHDGLDKFRVNLTTNVSTNPLHCDNFNPETGKIIRTTAAKIVSSDITEFIIEHPLKTIINVDNASSTNKVYLQHDGNDQFTCNGTQNDSLVKLHCNDINPLSGSTIRTSATSITGTGSELMINNATSSTLNADTADYCVFLKNDSDKIVEVGPIAVTKASTKVNGGLVTEEGLFFRNGFTGDTTKYNCSILKEGGDNIDINSFSQINMCLGSSSVRTVISSLDFEGKTTNNYVDGFSKETYSEAGGLTLVHDYIHPSKTFTKKYNYSAIDPFITEAIGSQEMTKYTENGEIYWQRFFAINGEGPLSINSAAKLFIQTCDKRNKNSIEDITYGLNEILKLNPKKFYYNNNETNLKQYGFIAQEVSSFMSDATPISIVERNKEKVERYGFNMDVIITSLVNSIKELNTKIETLSQSV